jgi:hypothetical protein
MLSLLVLVTLPVDYYINNDLMQENKVCFWLSLLMVANIVRKLVIPTQFLLMLIMNLAIIGIAMFSFGLLLLIGWGNAFQGRDMSFVWVLGLLLAVALSFEAIREIAKGITSFFPKQ